MANLVIGSFVNRRKKKNEIKDGIYICGKCSHEIIIIEGIIQSVFKEEKEKANLYCPNCEILLFEELIEQKIAHPHCGICKKEYSTVLELESGIKGYCPYHSILLNRVLLFLTKDIGEISFNSLVKLSFDRVSIALKIRDELIKIDKIEKVDNINDFIRLK